MWRLIALLMGSALLLSACVGNETTSGTPTACNAGARPNITVDIPATAPTEDSHLGIAELSAKDSLSSTVPALQRYKETLGLTAVNLAANIDGNIRADPRWGKWCAVLTNATVKINWDTTVFLAHELIPGSCPYRAVREHEQMHVDLDRSLLPILRFKIETALEKLSQTTYWETSSSYAIAELDLRAKQVAQQALDDFERERDAEQLTIDTPAEYDRVEAVCGRSAFPTLATGASSGM
ncbi:MAG TPA: hypothetical protein VM659_00645 [Dongiaceae bacterium]|nr:hypothetical protein [Dongiaceae bacterium]